MKRILTILAFCLAIGLPTLWSGFWYGSKIQNAHWSEAVNRETRHHKLTDLRMCFYAVEADTLRFVVLLRKEYLTSTIYRMATCQIFIEDLGKNAEDEEFGSVMGKMLLFFDSYTETVKEILGRQIIFQTLYNDAAAKGEELEFTQEMKELAIDQKLAIEDTRRFLDEFEQLIEQVW